MSEQRRGPYASEDPDAGRILVADDAPEVRTLIRRFLEHAGFCVEEAGSGLEALAVLRDKAVDLAVLDVMMPGMSGIDVCRELRKTQEGIHLPVIVMTAFEDHDTRVRAKMAGADDYQTKPLYPQELLARIQALLDLKRSQDMLTSQQRTLETKIERYSAMLLQAERLAFLGTLAGAVGHELGNAATIFDNALDHVLERAAEGLPPEEDYLRMLRRVNEHLATHARNLLNLGRPGPDHGQENDLRLVVEGILTMLSRSGRTKYVRICTDFPHAPVPVTVSATRIEQVFGNLVANAADAYADGAHRDPVVEVSISLGGERASCAVTDKGPGIAPEAMERIFEPYFTTKEPGRGTGLGLPVVRQIVEGYGGQLAVDSEVGVGTTVRFDFPLSERVRKAS